MMQQDARLAQGKRDLKPCFGGATAAPSPATCFACFQRNVCSRLRLTAAVERIAGELEGGKHE